MTKRKNRWMLEKGSKYRNKMALILNSWRKTHNISKTVKDLSISQPTVQNALRQSKIYMKSKYKDNRVHEKDILTQIKEKNSFVRNQVSFLLRIWRKNKSITKISKISGLSKAKIRLMLKLSKFYKKSNSKNSNIYKMSQKNSKKRKELAKILNIWRKNHSLKETSKELDISFASLIRRITISKRYMNSKYRKISNQKNYSDNQMKCKNSEYRNKLAIILRKWRKTRSIIYVGKELKINPICVGKFLSSSKIFTNRKKYTDKDSDYINKWGKKLWAIKLLGGSCQKCHNNDIFCLEFHHNEKNKEQSISNIIQKRPGGWNIKKIKAEVVNNP